jgi:hypothetical protein
MVPTKAKRSLVDDVRLSTLGGAGNETMMIVGEKNVSILC